MFKGPIHTSVPNARPIFLQELGCSCTKLRYMVTRVRQLCISKATHVHGARSIFSSEKSANDHDRSGSEPCSFKTISAESAQEQRKKEEEKRIGTQQTLFEVFEFATLGDRGEKRSLAHSGRGTNSRGGRGAGSKSLPKPKSGPRKSDSGSWFAKRAFSNQLGQGGPAATSHHREAGQASCHREQTIDCRTEGHVGAAAQNVHYARPASSGDRSMRVVQNQEN